MATANTSAGPEPTGEDVHDSPLASELETLDIKESGQKSRFQENEEDKLRRENAELRKVIKILRWKNRELEEKFIHKEIEEAEKEKPRFDHALENKIQELSTENKELKIQERGFRSLFRKKKQEIKELREENKILQKTVEDLQEMPDQAMQAQDVPSFRVSEEDQHDAAQELYFIGESRTTLSDALSDYPNRPGRQSDTNEEEDVEDGNKQQKNMERAEKGNKGTNDIFKKYSVSEKKSTEFLDKIRDLAKDRDFFTCKVSCGKLCVLLIFRLMELKFCREKLFSHTSVEVEKHRSDAFHPDECQFFVESLLKLGIVKLIFQEDDIHIRKPFATFLQEAKNAFREKNKSIGLIIFGYAKPSIGHCVVIFQDDDEVQIYDVQKDCLWVEMQNDTENGKLIQVALVVEEKANKLLKTCGVETCCPP